MIIHSKDEEKQYEFLVKNHITSDLLSIQDVLDGIKNIKLPEGRTFSNTPFCIALSDGIPRILVGDSMNNVLLMSINSGLNILLNLRDNVYLVTSQEDEICKKMEEYKKENSTLKRKISILEKELEN